ncbi:hypothetical protein [Paramagnetospirillum magneticum]|uniref:Uncharacterized protein n=1 Tax=Paramagnetospirillum magneticum (strain ATCC 700264 / AMB-1) TaxID=342108 RepID=Q2W284_PARM1|nr:hypothetical protein [Paramagnetospirillum magneticum]BAE52041.1 hypothetical protein amb3237 [Paramagnetospirillum magneticum AMB-1]
MRLTALAVLALMAWALPVRAETKPTVPCLTCPRIVPACWMMVYRWTDYNLRSGPGNHLVITDGPPPTRPQLAQAADEVMRTLPKGMKTSLVGTSRIDCPEPIKAAARKP